MKKLRHIICISLICTMFSSFLGCETAKHENIETEKPTKTERSDYDLIQFSKIKEGDQVATIKTSLGIITIRLFPDLAPKAVSNFTSLSESEYYNGITFHRVINGFMVQTGDPTATGCGGESTWGSSFEDEFSPSLRNFYGAVSMANSGPNTNGSQFFIVQAKNNIPNSNTYYRCKNKENFLNENDNEAMKKYLEVGGTPWLDGYHTVFGHVIDGFDVLEKIATTKTDPNDKPLDPITIESITLTSFDNKIIK